MQNKKIIHELDKNKLNIPEFWNPNMIQNSKLNSWIVFEA